MNGFTYKDGTLYADNIAVPQLAEIYGTPSYIYCPSIIDNQLHALQGALTGVAAKGKTTLIAYACKANSNIAILNHLARQGCGCDVVSGGELDRALASGIDPQRIVFSGVGKTDEEIRSAIKTSIYQINVESLPELKRIIALSNDMQTETCVAFRMNPDVEAGTHEKITTGKSDNKFGMLRDDIKVAFELCRNAVFVKPVGISMHIGSQLTALEPYKKAFAIMADFVQELRDRGHGIDRLDIGGGLGVIYDNETPVDPAAYAALIKDIIAPLDTHIVLEPGRFLTANAGILLSRVIYEKTSEQRRYLILDTGMNDLMRPALYDAYHAISPVTIDENREQHLYDVVGPVCETGDTFAKKRMLQETRDGELVALQSAGAYGAVMGSNYNTRPLPTEIMVLGEQHAAIRKRQNIQAIINEDILPDWLDKES